MFLHLYLTYSVSFSLYTTCLCFTLDALMNLVLSVSVKTGCKSTLLLKKKKKKFASLPCHDLSSCKVFQEFVVGLNLCTFVSYGIVVLDFSHNCYLWFCHVLPNGGLLGSYFL